MSAGNDTTPAAPSGEPAGPPEGGACEPAAVATTDASPRRFPIVGIGASAGGLEALEALTRRLFRDGMAFVVVQHLAPGHESVLAEILARCTPLRVVTIEDGQRVEPGTIHVTPPNAMLSLEDGVLRITRPVDRWPPHTIDHFLRSLASDRGTTAIGVVLSGAGSDGTVGLRTIKEEGGITFVQEPGTASQPSMPQSVLDAGCADFCLAPGEIGDELMRLSTHPYVARTVPPSLFNQEALSRLFGLLRRAFGVDFSAYKLSTIARRIDRRMALQKLEKSDDYLRLLETTPSELSLLYSDLLIGVTGFFRDREPFEALQQLVFPRLLENRSAGSPIRIWVPGCSTGEEAYSIAIGLLEYLETHATGDKIPIQIFATDIDENALVRARAAFYPSSIEVDVSSERLHRFFTRQDKGYQVSRELRDLVVFARHNLGKDPPFSHLDLVSCRNVLIYLQSQLQKKVLRVFHYALNPEAFLLLGSSESVGEAADLFSLMDRGLKIYVKKNVASTGVFEFGAGYRLRGEGADRLLPVSPAHERRSPASVQQLADRQVLDRYGPSGIVVDEKLDVIQFRGQTGPFLAPSPGVATLNLLKLVRPELLVVLRAAVQQALSTNLPATSDRVRFRGDRAAVVIDVLPLHEAGTTGRCLLVLFREVVPAGTPAAGSAPVPATGSAADARVAELERELVTTKEFLQSSIQELETANEELQSANEELQSANEELQSTNEELETSKEELQSTNEELATVNDELHDRMSQLSVANDDLQNVLANVSAPVVLVGMDLRIRRFSAAAQLLLKLIPGDVGRPVAYLGSVVNLPQLEACVGEAVNSVRVRDQRVRCSDGRWYTMRTGPYRTGDHSIRGAVIEFMPAGVAGRAGVPPDLSELVGKVLSTLPHVLLLLDGELRLVWANRAFFDTFLVGAESLGRTLEDLWPGRLTHPTLWELLEKAAGGGPVFRDVRVEHPFGRASDRPMKFAAHAIPADAERKALLLVEMEEFGVGGAG